MPHVHWNNMNCPAAFLGKRIFGARSGAIKEDYSEELLNNGLANYLEVLTARQNALNSELNLVDSQYSRLSAIVELYRALGGGWK